MATEILMPALSPTMEEGTLTKWLVKEGDSVASGDILAEIETDKATMEFEAVDEGVIGKLLVSAGSEGIKVNAPIALLLEDGESVTDTKDLAPPTPEPTATEPAKDRPTDPANAAAPSHLRHPVTTVSVGPLRALRRVAQGLAPPGWYPAVTARRITHVLRGLAALF